MRSIVVLSLLTACDSSSKPPPAIDAAVAIDSPPASDVVAVAMPGGLDRIRILTTTGTSCFAIQIVNPAVTTHAITTPAEWSVERIFTARPPAACHPATAGPADESVDGDGYGSIEFVPGNPYPTTIDTLDVTLMFSSQEPWVAPAIILNTGGIPVE